MICAKVLAGLGDSNLIHLQYCLICDVMARRLLFSNGLHYHHRYNFNEQGESHQSLWCRERLLQLRFHHRYLSKTHLRMLASH